MVKKIEKTSPKSKKKRDFVIKLPKTVKKAIHKAQTPIRYISDSSKEMKQVHWPNRQNTWSLTLAVIVYTLFFVFMIIALDFAFKTLFELLIK